MAKAAILMPYPELRNLAESLIGQYTRIEPMAVEYVQTSGIAARAKSLEEKGCELIIARGLQARIARASVLIPVIEMRASTQELAALVMELKQKVDVEPGKIPLLGIVGFFNMFHSTDRFRDLLGIDVRVYTATEIQQYSELVDRAKSDGCLGVIGGELVGRRAEALGMQFCFLSLGEESMREVLESASRVGYSIDLLKRSNAEMSAMLDNTFSAILQVDKTGTVKRANKAFYELLGSEPDDVLERKVWEISEMLSQQMMEQVLSEGREVDSELITVGNRNALTSIIPVQVDGRTESAILTFQEGKRIAEMDSRLRQELARYGFVAVHRFEQVPDNSAEMKHTMDQLRRLSLYPVPVLLTGESGVGKGILAQCIHNESQQRNGPYITLDCSIWHPDDLDEKLFGRFSARKDSEPSIVEQARGGTLYLRQVELLSVETQYKLMQLAKGQYFRNGPSLSVPIDVRLVLSSEVDLRERVSDGLFRRDLFYALSAFMIEVPPMRKRREDIMNCFERYLTDWCKKMVRHMRLTEDARKFICEYDWPGNLDQMESLCQRLVLLSEKRTVDEAVICSHLQAMASRRVLDRRTEELKNPRAAELTELLKKHHGNREKAAEELGVSKTTLWRRMKRYGIEGDML